MSYLGVPLETKTRGDGPLADWCFLLGRLVLPLLCFYLLFSVFCLLFFFSLFSASSFFFFSLGFLLCFSPLCVFLLSIRSPLFSYSVVSLPPVSLCFFSIVFLFCSLPPLSPLNSSSYRGVPSLHKPTSLFLISMASGVGFLLELGRQQTCRGRTVGGRLRLGLQRRVRRGSLIGLGTLADQNQSVLACVELST